ncbi:Uncharacterised protein [Mycobacteroides abscessus subsp. abscessus]|nr:Uncharacterised protein [Mycobacteroides abscessus subsp. abscessus]
MDCWSYIWKVSSFFPRVSYPSQAQPEPWTPFAAAENWSRNLSNPPNCSLMAPPSSPSGLSPPWGDKFFHQME